MTKLSTEQQALRRLAAARATRGKVDHNGRPLGEPTTLEYDENGVLITDSAPAEPKSTERG